MGKEQELYNKFVDVLFKLLEDKPSAQHLSVILNFLKYANSQKEDVEPKEVFEAETSTIQLPFE